MVSNDEYLERLVGVERDVNYITKEISELRRILDVFSLDSKRNFEEMQKRYERLLIPVSGITMLISVFIGISGKLGGFFK